MQAVVLTDIVIGWMDALKRVRSRFLFRCWAVTLVG